MQTKWTVDMEVICSDHVHNHECLIIKSPSHVKVPGLSPLSLKMDWTGLLVRNDAYSTEI